MTDRLKREARQRAAATGEPYTVARRAVTRQEHPQGGPGVDAAVRTLLNAWDLMRRTKPSPAAERQAEREHAEQVEWEQEQEAFYGPDSYERRKHLALRSCAACGQRSRRIVRRWQAGKVSFSGDPGDPAADQYGHIFDLSQPPSFTGQPSWAVCGTICARRIIEDDRAQGHPGGHRVAGNDQFFYEVKSFRYLPHESELPGILVRLRGNMELLGYSREGIDRAVGDGDMARAAYHLEGLRRDIARTAVILAELETRTPPGRQFPPGSPEPDGIQVRHGGVIYSNMRFLSFDPARRDYWESTDGTRYTWLELTKMAGGDLTEVPREHLHIPREDADDEDDFQSDELFWYGRNDRANPRPQLDDEADDD
jgi:hypothetical protein